MGLTLGRLSQETKQTLLISVIFVVEFVIGGILQPNFWTAGPLSFFLRNLSLMGILAIAQTLVILSGGIDMSTGATYFFASSICGWMTAITGDFLLPIVAALALGLVIGAVNGICIAKLRVPPIIATLGMLIFLTGLAFVIIGPAPKGGAHPLLIEISRGGSTYIWIGVAVLFLIISERTNFGWSIRAIGSNPIASQMSGIDVQTVRIWVYMISGLVSALAGLLYLGWAKTPFIVITVSAMGIDITIQSMAAVIIGGTLFLGGLGGFDRTLVGTLIAGTLFALIRMFGFGQEMITIVEGSFLVIIVYVYLRIYAR